MTAQCAVLIFASSQINSKMDFSSSLSNPIQSKFIPNHDPNHHPDPDHDPDHDLDQLVLSSDLKPIMSNTNHSIIPPNHHSLNPLNHSHHLIPLRIHCIKCSDTSIWYIPADDHPQSKKFKSSSPLALSLSNRNRCNSFSSDSINTSTSDSFSTLSHSSITPSQSLNHPHHGFIKSNDSVKLDYLAYDFSNKILSNSHSHPILNSFHSSHGQFGIVCKKCYDTSNQITQLEPLHQIDNKNFNAIPWSKSTSIKTQTDSLVSKAIMSLPTSSTSDLYQSNSNLHSLSSSYHLHSTNQPHIPSSHSLISSQTNFHQLTSLKNKLNQDLSLSHSKMFNQNTYCQISQITNHSLASQNHHEIRQSLTLSLTPLPSLSSQNKNLQPSPSSTSLSSHLSKSHSKLSSSSLPHSNSHELSPTSLPRQATPHRGANLSSMLRQAKIPSHSFDEKLSKSYRHTPNMAERWRLAMIGTPRDRLRSFELLQCQSYSDHEPFLYHRFKRVSQDSNLSKEETSQPDFHSNHSQLKNGLSLIDSINFGNELDGSHHHQLCSSPDSSNNLVSLTPNQNSIISRIPLIPNPSTDSSISSDLVKLHLTTPTDSQEILRPSAIPLTDQLRPLPSVTTNLLNRLVSLSNDKNRKNLHRRPNTSTGTHQSKFSIKPKSKHESNPDPSHLPEKNSPINMITTSISASLVSGISELRPLKLSKFKRPATATGSGQVTEPISLLAHNKQQSLSVTVSSSKNQPSNVAYTPTLSLIDGTCDNKLPSQTDQDQIAHFPNQKTSNQQPVSRSSIVNDFVPPLPLSKSFISNQQSTCQTPNPTPPVLTKSVSNISLKGQFGNSKRCAFYSSIPLALSLDQVRVESDVKTPLLISPSNLSPQEFFSKSRNLVLSILPRPSSESFHPGQQIILFIKITNKVKFRKYTSVSLSLVGNMQQNPSDSQVINTHEFLRHDYNIHPNSHDPNVRVISDVKADETEWQVDLVLPHYSNCRCQPGPLPIPNSGETNFGNVNYSIQLFADRKQILTSQEFINVKFHLSSRAEARFQATTCQIRTPTRKLFAKPSGQDQSIVEEYSLSHQVYYQAIDRLRIGYQLELKLISNMSTSPSMTDVMSKLTKVQLSNLVLDQNQPSPIKVTDCRSSVLINQAKGLNHQTSWVIKGYLEVKDMGHRMRSMKTLFEGGAPKTARPEVIQSGGFGLLSRANQTISSGANAISKRPKTSSSPTEGLFPRRDSERQSRSGNGQIFLIVHVDQYPGVLASPIEVKSLIGAELRSPCPLKQIGDDMMRKALLEEKMRRLQKGILKN
ncbi:hypothetical protein O181_049982 [Austropuccinia psidii MF-1]|uniref:Uncharacterized protein n=1 Tax=Austropuccinia psidii MF-1 TaxID=1389203 RepID=A0A9Q3HN58_9BASI|nr:hypothetical protein [Austropuccinia psidii MF-1]